MNRLLLWIALPLVGLSGALASAQDQSGVTDRLLEDLQKQNPKSEDAQPRSWGSVAEEMRRISAQLPRAAQEQETLAAQNALIEELTKLLSQSQAGSSTSTGASKSGDNPNQIENNSQNSSASGKGSSKESSVPAGAATGSGPATKAGEIGKAAADRTSSGERQGNDSLMRRAWGQLPGRVRDRLQAGAPEKFHQKYQNETESYFKRLSELEHRP